MCIIRCSTYSLDVLALGSFGRHFGRLVLQNGGRVEVIGTPMLMMRVSPKAVSTRWSTDLYSFKYQQPSCQH